MAAIWAATAETWEVTWAAIWVAETFEGNESGRQTAVSETMLA